MSAQMTAPGQEGDLQPLRKTGAGLYWNGECAEGTAALAGFHSSRTVPIFHPPNPLFLGPKVEEMFLHAHALLLARFNSCLVRDRLLAVMWSQGQHIVEVSNKKEK